MAKQTGKILTGVILFMAIAAAVVYWKITTTPPPPKRIPVIPVRVAVPEFKPMFQTVELSGEILPEKQADIYARVQGSVSSVRKQIGEYARAGEIVATIEDAPFRQEARRAEATLRQSQAALAAAMTTYNRAKLLAVKEFTSKQELETAEAQLAIAKARTESDSAVLENARITLSYCTITAPFSGYITRRYVDAGATIGSSPIIYTIVDVSALKIRVEIPEKSLAAVQEITAAELMADAVPAAKFTATLLRVNAALDRTTRTATAEYHITDPKHLLKPGMYATLHLQSGNRNAVLTLPKESLLSDDAGKYVMLAVNKNGKKVARKQSVGTGLSDDMHTEIRNGLSLTDTVIVAGQQNVRDKGEVLISN